MSNFREYNQAQGIFRTIVPAELLEMDHPARIIDKVVEMLDLSKLYGYYKEEGNPPYHPKMMLKVLFYGYYAGLMSCRKLWKGLEKRADFIYLSGDQVPNFRTINTFRTRHIKELPEIFAQIVFLCRKLGMIDFKELAVDGQKIRANADFHKSKDRHRVEESYKRVKEGIKKLVEKEVSEDFTDEKKEKRIEKLKKREKKLLELKEVLEGLDEKSATINMTDAEAKVMKHKDKRSLPSYNQQSAVDGKYGVTTAVNTTDKPDCPDDLFGLVDQAKENSGGKYENVLADSGFCDYGILEKVEEERGEEFYIPDKRYEVTEKGKTFKGRYDISQFKRGEDGQMYCPEGQVMKLVSTEKYEDGHRVMVYEGIGCEGCKKHDKCTGGKKRKIAIDSREKYREKMREKLRSDKGREVYMRRQGIVEPVNGDDQKNRGWGQHHLRGKAKASLEFMLIRITSNLGKIIKYKAQELLAMG
jgi:transposase